MINVSAWFSPAIERNSGRSATINLGASVREITLSAAPAAGEHGYLEIEIRDTGPGFAPEIADRLFKPFSTTKSSGMGLGLSISRTIIEAHGGKIWVAASAGAGATIRFTLPANDSDAV